MARIAVLVPNLLVAVEDSTVWPEGCTYGLDGPAPDSSPCSLHTYMRMWAVNNSTSILCNDTQIQLLSFCLHATGTTMPYKTSQN